MHVQHGSYRTVLVIPSAHLAIKVPRVRVREFVSNVRYHVRGFREGKGSWRVFWQYTFLKGVDTYCTGQRALFKGVVDNWREWRFWSETRHPVLAPTYGWFGISVQRTVDPIEIVAESFFARMLEIVGEDVFDDIHHFANPGNFGSLNGRLVAVDYASPGVQQLLLRCGEAIIRDFRG